MGGIAFTEVKGGPTSDKPMTLYFNKAGQVSGVGVHVYGDGLPLNLIDKGFWKPVGQTNDTHTISVTFRDAANQCASGTPSPLPLGDRLIVNADTIKWPLPVTETDAAKGNWTKGSCFQGMGHHYFYDLATAPKMSWEAANLLPVVTMFHEGEFQAIFFSSPVVQQSLWGAHEWEPIPLPNVLYCKNTCDSSCTFHDTSVTSTLHVYMKDHTKPQCAGGCKIGCCP